MSVPSLTGRRLAGLAAGVVAVLLLAAPGAEAQNSELRGLVDRVDRLQREVQTLQRQVATGEADLTAIQTAQSGQSGAPLSGDRAMRLEMRLNQYDAVTRQLTGRVEELEFKIRQLTDRLDKLVSDVDLRLQRLEGGGAAAEATAEVPPAGARAPAQTLAPTPGSPPAPSGTQPGVLGYLSESDMQKLQPQSGNRQGVAQGATQAPAQTPAQTAATPAPVELRGETPEARYDYAFGLLRQADYAAAEAALRQFLDRDPEHALAGNAMYWLGETYYVRQDYAAAAKIFAEGFQRYPDSVKAPDNLLKLGMALASLDQKEDACGTLIELAKRYPNAAQEILRRAERERQRLGC